MTVVDLPSKASAQAWVHAQVARLKRPAVLLFSGPLGAGKTQFVRWFLEELQVNEAASPTFAIHHSYAAPGGGVDHVDLYRVQSEADLEASGFWDLLTQEHGLVMVEWAERLPLQVWPDEWQRWQLKLSPLVGAPEGRRLEFAVLDPKTPSAKAGPAR